MKRINILFVALAAVVFAACDPGYTCDSNISNQSGHRVKVTPLNYTVYTSPYDTSIHDTNYFSSVIELLSGEEVAVASTGGLGIASREECIYNMRRYLGDSVELLFDGNKRVVFRNTDTTGVSPYNFNSTTYYYVQNLRVKSGNAGNPYYGTLTLNISDEMYQLAQ